MDFDGFDRDALIERFSWRPAYIVDSMIRIDDTIQSTVIPPSFTSSSVGSLEAFPLELLHSICNSLDFQSLSRFSRVSHQANRIVESLPAYQRLMKHASTALIALSRTKLITVHTVATIHAALLAHTCVSCRKFAAFLFLPTCERCCYKCLYEERSLQVIEHPMAEYCFGLSQEDLDQIPNMLSIPGTYSAGHALELHTKSFKLVSLKEAHALGISIHGSQEAMESTRVPKDALLESNGQTHPLRRSQRITGRETANRLDDEFCGVASIPFPFLRPDGQLENGLWCPGCRITSENYMNVPTLLSDWPTRALQLRKLLTVEFQARSRYGLLKHIRHCQGAKDLLREPVNLLPWATAVHRERVTIYGRTMRGRSNSMPWPEFVSRA